MIIGIAGKARSGKNQFAEYLVKYFKDGFQREFRLGAFADALKNMCMEHFNLTKDQLWGDQKELEDKRYSKVPHVWDQRRANGWWCGSCEPLPEWWTPREIMQALGGFYRSIDYDFWIKKFDEYYKSNESSDVIITDARHINECKYVRTNKGILIKIFRDQADEIHGMEHESETALDNYKDFDIYINNSGPIEDLEQSAFDTVNVIISIEKYVSEGGVYHGE